MKARAIRMSMALGLIAVIVEVLGAGSKWG